MYWHTAENARHRYFTVGSNRVVPGVSHIVHSIIRLRRKTCETGSRTSKQLEHITQMECWTDIGHAKRGGAEGNGTTRCELAKVARRISAVQVWPVDAVDRGIARNGKRSHGKPRSNGLTSGSNAGGADWSAASQPLTAVKSQCASRSRDIIESTTASDDLGCLSE